MRHLILLPGVVALIAACGGESRAPSAPTHRATELAPEASGTLVVALGGDYPDLRFPLTVTFDGGSAVVLDGGEHPIAVPANDTELTRITIEGWRPIWIHIPPGGTARLSPHPCCGITFDSNTYDDELARCATGDICPDGTEQVPHSLADDPVCHERERCAPVAKVRVVQEQATGPSTIVSENDETYLATRDPGAPLAVADRNIADMFSFAVEGASERQDIAMNAGVAYTVWLDGAEVTRISASRW